MTETATTIRNSDLTQAKMRQLACDFTTKGRRNTVKSRRSEMFYSQSNIVLEQRLKETSKEAYNSLKSKDGVLLLLLKSINSSS